MAEAKVLAFVKLGDVKAIVEQLLCELPGAHSPDVFRERNDDDIIDPGGGKQVKLVLERSEKCGTGTGSEGTCGMGIQGDNQGAQAKGAGAIAYVADDPAMATMDAVEVADCGDRGGCREVLQAAVDAH